MRRLRRIRSSRSLSRSAPVAPPVFGCAGASSSDPVPSQAPPRSSTPLPPPSSLACKTPARAPPCWSGVPHSFASISELLSSESPGDRAREAGVPASPSPTSWQAGPSSRVLPSLSDAPRGLALSRLVERSLSAPCVSGARTAPSSSHAASPPLGAPVSSGLMAAGSADSPHFAVSSAWALGDTWTVVPSAPGGLEAAAGGCQLSPCVAGQCRDGRRGLYGLRSRSQARGKIENGVR